MTSHLTSTWDQFKRDHPPGSQVTGTITFVAAFGMFVDLGCPFKALLLIPFLAPVEKGKRYPDDYPKSGETITAFIKRYTDPDDPKEVGKIMLTQKPN